MKKKLTALVLSAIMTLSMAAGAAYADETEAAKDLSDITIGCVWFNLTTEFQAKMRLALLADFEEKYPDATIKEIDGQSKPETQIAAVDTFIAQQVDCIVLSPLDAEQLVPAVEAAKEAGIPLIEVTVATNAGDAKTSYVGGNDVSAGEVCMSYLAEQAGGEGGVIVLQGPAGQLSQIQRLEGCQNVVDEYDGMEIVADKFCDWDRSAAMEAVENYIQSGLDFSVIYCENDEMALGAAAAIQGSDLEGKVLIGGVDGINDMINAINEGTVTCTSYYNAQGIADAAADAAIEVATGGEIDSFINVPFELVNADNVDEYQGQ